MDNDNNSTPAGEPYAQGESDQTPKTPLTLCLDWELQLASAPSLRWGDSDIIIDRPQGVYTGEYRSKRISGINSSFKTRMLTGSRKGQVPQTLVIPKEDSSLSPPQPGAVAPAGGSVTAVGDKQPPRESGKSG